MSNNLNSIDIENDEFKINDQDDDYKNLISRLKEMKTSIALLEKILFK